jgi:hypothetical protein
MLRLSYLIPLSKSEAGEVSLTIPVAVLVYHRDTLFSSWQALERQQELTNDPEIRERLDQINQILFSAWVMFREEA